MAQGGSLKFVVEVAANNATQTLNAITTAVDQAGVKMKMTMLGIGEGSRAAAEGSKGFEASLKGLKGEMASGDRTINFFARSLNNIVPEASAAGQGIRLLADGLIGGIGLGFALQGVMAVLTLFGEGLKESRKQAEESAKAARDAAVRWEELGDSFDKAYAKIGARKKSWQAQQVDDATADTTREIESEEQKLRETNAKLNEALRDRDKVGFFDNGAEERVVAALQEKEAIKQRIADLTRLRNDQRMAAAERAAQAGQQQAEESAAITFYQESSKVREKRTKELTALLKEQAEAARQAANRWQEAMASGDRTVPMSPQGQRQATETRSWMPNVTMGGLNLDKVTDQFNESTRKGWKADDKMLAEANKAGEQIGKAFAQPIVSSLEDAFAQMITGQKSFNDSMKDLWKSLASSLAKTAIGMAFSFIPGLGGLGGGLGNAIGGAIPSAAGGWSVPKGWNGLAMIHEEEVVLDRQTKRALMGGGGAPINVSIRALDAPSLVALMNSNPEAILGPIREARRDRRF